MSPSWPGRGHGLANARLPSPNPPSPALLPRGPLCRAPARGPESRAPVSPEQPLPLPGTPSDCPPHKDTAAPSPWCSGSHHADVHCALCWEGTWCPFWVATLSAWSGTFYRALGLSSRHEVMEFFPVSTDTSARPQLCGRTCGRAKGPPLWGLPRDPSSCQDPVRSGRTCSRRAKNREDGLGSMVCRRAQEKTEGLLCPTAAKQDPEAPGQFLDVENTGRRRQQGPAGPAGVPVMLVGTRPQQLSLLRGGGTRRERPPCPAGNPRGRRCCHSRSQTGLVPPSSAKGGSGAQTSTSPPPVSSTRGHGTPAPSRHGSATWPAR